jgi:hypothetical protein
VYCECVLEAFECVSETVESSMTVSPVLEVPLAPVDHTHSPLKTSRASMYSVLFKRSLPTFRVLHCISCRVHVE